MDDGSDDLAGQLARWAETITDHRAAARRALVAGDNLAAVAALTQSIKVSKEARDALAVHLKRTGATWQTIADALGTPRQAAWRKYKHLV